MMVGRDCIKLRHGAYFSFSDIGSNRLYVHDIAHALSHICRFTGQTDVFYSVAQHCVLASYHCPKYPFYALMHDAAEAVLGDVSSPLKRLLPDYRAIEEHVERWLFDRYGMPYPLPPEVKDADIFMLRWEQRDLMQAERDRWEETEGVHPPATRIIAWTPSEARAAFLSRYDELTGS